MLVPELEITAFAPASVADADGPVAAWETTDGAAMSGFRADGVGWVVIDGVASYRFAEGGAVSASGDAAPDAIREAFRRSVLPLVVQARGTQVIHASAVRGPGGLVGLCGRSGAGKSTLAGALHRAGREAVADDALGFAPSGSGVEAFTLPFGVRLRPSAETWLGAVDDVAGEGGDRAPLAGLVLLEPDSDPPVTVAAEPPAAALGALMPHAYCFALEEGKERLVHDYTALVSRVPVHRLQMPRDLAYLDETVAAIEALLDG